MDVREEGHGNAGFCMRFLMAVLQRKVQVIDIEQVAVLRECAADANHIVRHQTRLDDFLVDPVAFFALFLGQEAGQLTCLVFQAPHQVAVLRVAWLVHQTNGHGDVVPSFVAAGFGVQSSDVGGLAREFRIAHDQLAD